MGRADRLQKEDFTSPQSSAWMALPVSPDKAAVLLLLARNECVGVRSLLTTLLSQGLSCRRRALSGEFSKVADEDESRLLMTGSTCFERFMVETDRLSGSPL